MPNPAENDISNWLIKNPQRLNLARTGFSLRNLNVTEANLQQKSQELDLWSGKNSSSFVYNDTSVAVETVVDPVSDTVAIGVESKLFQNGMVFSLISHTRISTNLTLHSSVFGIRLPITPRS